MTEGRESTLPEHEKSNDLRDNDYGTEEWSEGSRHTVDARKNSENGNSICNLSLMYTTHKLEKKRFQKSYK